MRKRTILFIICIFIAAFLLLIPFLVGRQDIQEQITDHVNQSYGLIGNTSAMKWRWLPVPALEIHDLAVENESFSFHTDKLLLYPNWLSIFLKEVSIGSAKLLQPDLLIKDPAKYSALKPPDYPKFNVTVVAGRIRVLPTLADRGPQLRQLDLQEVNGRIFFNYHRVKFDLNSQPNFSNSINLDGRIDLAKKYYRLDIKANGLNISEIIASSQPRFWKPVSTDFTLRFNIEGLGLANGRVTISEQNQPFSIKLSGIPFHVEKFDNLKLTWHEQDLFFGISNLQLTDPTLRLDGQASLRHPEDAQAPQWDFDLEANEIGITNLRQRLLSLWGDVPTVKKVCTIVRGGKADNARFIFSGPGSDLQHLNLMKIWATADNVSLYIPDLDLDIDRASGPISIIKGNLAGKGLSAEIGTSHGENGTILLSLSPDQHDFMLDVDLDLDLGELQESLEPIFNEESFTHELEMFSSLQGRVSGNLALGDDLRDLKTHISVVELKATGTYDRLPWPFAINSAQLKLFPGRFQWEAVNGAIGQQSILHSTGELIWDDQPILALTRLDASLDLQQLFQQGSLAAGETTFYLKNYFTGVADNISGTAQLSNSHLSGPVLKPEAWRFATDIASADLTIASPLLPQAISSSAMEIALSSQKATFNGIFKVFDQQLYLKGDYRHRFFRNWNGEFGVNGMISKKIGEWLKSRELVPAHYFPRLPFQLEQFRLTTHSASEAFQTRGRIIASPPSAEITLDFEINRQPALELNKLIFQRQGSQGELTFNRWHNQDNKTLLTWQGELETDTLNRLFTRNIFTNGRIKGVFSRLTNETKPLRTTYTGYLKADNLSWQLAGQPSTLAINDLSLTGKNELLKINTLELKVADQQALIEGAIKTSGQHHAVDLALTSRKLSWHNLQKALSEYAEYTETQYDSPQAEIMIAKNKPLLPAKVSGSINFNIDHFSFTPDGKERATDQAEGNNGEQEPPPTYVWSPIQGTATSIDPRNIDLNITTSTLCGIEMNGLWKLGEKSPLSVFNLPQSTTPLRFENVLPCLGVKANLIEGPFYLQGSIKGIPDNWSEGELFLKSPNGLIKKMNLLSKVFSVVNFTELFTWETQPGQNQPGLRYNDMILISHVEANKLLIDKAVLKGKGVNLTGRGEINLVTLDAALTFFIAPFKMLDSVVTNVPLVGKVLGGKKKSILTFPVGVKGHLSDPEVTALPASAIGSATLEFIMDALTLPFKMFIPSKDRKDDFPLETERDQANQPPTQ